MCTSTYYMLGTIFGSDTTRSDPQGLTVPPGDTPPFSHMKKHEGLPGDKALMGAAARVMWIQSDVG